MAKRQRVDWSGVLGRQHGCHGSLTAAIRSAYRHLVHLRSLGLSAVYCGATPSGAARC